MSLRILIVGYGRMGKEIDALSGLCGCEVVERLDIHNNDSGAGMTPEQLQDIDVAIDFSTAAVTLDNLPRLAAAGVNSVIGTTGWNDQEAAMRQVVEKAGIGVVVAANFSLGVNLFQGIVERASSLPATPRRLRCMDPRITPCGQGGRTVGNRPRARRGHACVWLHFGDRRRLDPSRLGPGHPLGRIRRTIRDDHTDPHGPEPLDVCPRRARGRAMGQGTAGLVHDA